MNKLVVAIAIVAVVVCAEQGNHRVYSQAEIAATPDTFDARTQWPSCKSIGEIVDQHTSGATWAFASVGAMTDRMCIAHPDNSVTLSAMDVELCSGCFGRMPTCPWLYWVNTGIVSESCYPLNTTSVDCANKCTGNPTLDWNKDKRKGKSNYSISGEENMKTDLYQNGPFQAVFAVYSDFLEYKNGIYQHTSGPFQGSHTVRVIGYGEENGVKYWTCANSWGTVWGEHGFFRIRRGTNECGIEKVAYAGLPL